MIQAQIVNNDIQVWQTWFPKEEMFITVIWMELIVSSKE